MASRTGVRKPLILRQRPAAAGVDISAFNGWRAFVEQAKVRV